jgi:hypothetical protein
VRIAVVAAATVPVAVAVAVAVTINLLVRQRAMIDLGKKITDSTISSDQLGILIAHTIQQSESLDELAA